jgi:hypothetical protein
VIAQYSALPATTRMLCSPRPAKGKGRRSSDRPISPHRLTGLVIPVGGRVVCSEGGWGVRGVAAAGVGPTTHRRLRSTGRREESRVVHLGGGGVPDRVALFGRDVPLRPMQSGRGPDSPWSALNGTRVNCGTPERASVTAVSTVTVAGPVEVLVVFGLRSNDVKAGWCFLCLSRRRRQPLPVAVVDRRVSRDRRSPAAIEALAARAPVDPSWWLPG